MPDGQQTIAHAFNDQGYHTAWFGKWHVDGAKQSEGRTAHWIVPPERRGGFQEWIGYENNNSQWDCWVHGGEGDNAFLRQLDGFETDGLTNLLLDYLQQRQDSGSDQPFFAALSVQPPHWPTQCPPEYRKLRGDEVSLRPNVPPGGKGERIMRAHGPGYYGMIENWDWNVGRVLAALRRLGLAHTTHVMVFADHGDMLGSHGRNGKVLPYEESIRTPFIISGDNFYYNQMRSGATDALINHVDIAPTTLGLCGIEAPGWMEGHDYSHVRDRRRKPERSDPDCAYIQAIEDREESPAYRGIVTKDGWKYACTAKAPWVMFNLNNDPFEMDNQAQIASPEVRAKRAELHARLTAKIEEVGDDFPLPEANPETTANGRN